MKKPNLFIALFFTVFMFLLLGNVNADDNGMPPGSMPPGTMPPMGSHGGMPPGSMPPGTMPPMGSHGGMPPGSMPPMGEPMCFDPARGEIPCSEMPGADPNMPPPGNSCASIPDPVNRAECEKHIHKGPGPGPSGMPPMGSHGGMPPGSMPPGTTPPMGSHGGMPPGSMPPGTMPPMGSHGGPNDHHGDQDAAHCRAMGMADGSPHVDPPQNILDQVEAEYEANCQSGNCFLGEGNYKLLEDMGHTRAKVDCFLAEGLRKHNEQHGGMPPGSMPPMGEPMCFDPARGEIPCSEMPGADPNMPPLGNSCASIPDPVNRAECEKHIHKGPGPGPSGMPPMGSHGGTP